MNVLSVIGLIIFISSVPLAVYSFINASRSLHWIWGGFSLSVAWWGFGIFKFSTITDVEQSILWWRIAEVGVILIPIFLTHFVSEFLEKREKRFVFSLYLLGTVLVFLNLFTNYFVEQVHLAFNQFYYITATPLYSFFLLWFVGLVIYNITRLLNAYHTSQSNTIKHQIKYLVFSFLIGFIGGSTSFFQVYGVNIYPVFNITILISVLVVVYSMFKYRLLDIKIISTQLLIFSLWFFLLGRILLSEAWRERIIDGVLLVLVVIFGILIIRSILKEIESRERIEKLAKELEKTNERLKELDQLKSEFVSLATHQIRGPLTAIKGYASMMRDGDYGEVPARIKGTVDIIFESSNALTTVVQDFLDISRIEQGRMKYELTVFDFSKIVQSVGEELAPVGERRGLRVKLEIEPNIIVEADTGKMRQIIGNLIDNAIKYPSRGHIIVSLKKSGANARLEVKDTGVGIRPETLPKLFQKFSRAEDASKANVLGAGLGLDAAKKLLEAQSGTIWAESEGEEKGATFTVELPSVYKEVYE